MSSEKCPSITRRLEDVIWIRDWSREPRKPTTSRAQPSISGLKHTSAAAADMPMSLKHRHTRWNAKEPHPRLSYLTHDSERERPVYFQWQLIDTWPPPADVLSRMALTLTQSDAPTPLVEQAGLSQTPPPVPSRRKGRRTADFRARRVADRSVEDAN